MSTLFTPIDINLESDPRDRNIADNSSDSWVVEDQQALLKLIENVRKNLKVTKIRSILDMSLGIISSLTAAHAGTSPSFFPVFSHQGFASNDFPERIVLRQDNLQPKQFSSFISFFLRIPVDLRPKIDFRYHDRQTCLDLLSKVAALTKLSEVFAGQRRSIHVDPAEPNDDEFISFILDGNYDPRLATEVSVDDNFISCWAMSRTAKLYETPKTAQDQIEKTIEKVNLLFAKAQNSERRFWASLVIQLQLDLAYVKDLASNETTIALMLARELESPELIAHCQRFANQILGVSSEALAMLEDSCRRFDNIPANSEIAILFGSSRMGAIQNRNTTMLIASKTSPDPAEFLADYEEAKLTLPSYGNMALLGNAAAMAYLCDGDANKAIDIFEEALLQNSLPLDRLNINVNLLAAQFVESGSSEDRLFEKTCSEVETFELSESWEYERARMTVNLLRIANSPHQKDMVASIARNSPYWKSIRDDLTHASMMNFLMENRYSHYYEKGRIPGVFGRFSEKYQLSLCLDKDWT